MSLAHLRVNLMEFIVTKDRTKFRQIKCCSLLHSERHFFILKSQSFISFPRSVSPSFIEKRPTRLRYKLEIEIE